MKWLIWGRKQGKTHQTIKWFLEDPDNRTILTHDENSARQLRGRVLDVYPGKLAVDMPYPHLTAWKKMVERHVVGVATWQRPGHHDGWRGREYKIAVENLDLALPQLLHADVALVTASGVNEKPVGLRVDPDAVRFEQQREAEEQ